MYKSLILWLLWLILLPLSTLVQTGGPVYSGMLLIYDAIDTSFWEVNPNSLEVALWLDFDAPLLSINPLAFRVDRQSIIYFRVPAASERGASPFELIERDVISGIEFSIIKAQWIVSYPMPTNDARLMQIVNGTENYHCVLSFVTDLCSLASEEMVDFIRNDANVWQNSAGYVLTEKALYLFDLNTMSWVLLLENAWHLAVSAAYEQRTNRLYIAGFAEAPVIAEQGSQVMHLDLASLQLEILPFELQVRISPYDSFLISPDGRYLQYDTTREIMVIDLETGELVYRPLWYSDRAVWLHDSQRLLFTYYDHASSRGNRISQANILTREISVIYEGTAGSVWLYQVP